MDVFDLREKLIKDYASYIRSFITISDDRINNYVDNNLDNGLLWPDPLIQMNPSFEMGSSVDELVQQGVLHSECNRIFRIKESPETEPRPE